KFLTFTGMVGPIVNATVGVTALVMGEKIPSSEYMYMWFTWWMSNVAGIFIFSPALLAWGQEIHKYLIANLKNIKLKSHKLRRIYQTNNLCSYPELLSFQILFEKIFNPLKMWKNYEFILLIGLVIWLSYNAFWNQYELEYMLIPCLVWSVFRFGTIVSTSLIVFISSIAVLGTVRGLGVFSQYNLNESLIFLQCFIDVIVLSTLAFNAVVLEKKQAISILKSSQKKLIFHTEELTKKNLELAAARQTAVAANQTKSEFLTNMSHELRTPLNGILAIAQLFYYSPNLTEKEKQDIEIIQQSGTHLLTLINDILDISKIESGKMDLEYTTFNFPNFLTGILEICRHASAERVFCFHHQFNSAIPNFIHTDEKRLRQVLLNLLINAIKFTDKGEVLLIVDVVSQLKKDETVNIIKIRFEIIDTGVGIPPEKLTTIFIPFEQVGETRLKSQGTGLGLAISQKIINMMGSKIEVISELGKGSKFSFELDLETVVNHDFKNNDQINEQISKEFPLRILVAEDNLINQKVATKLFQKIGYKIEITNNGKEVLKCLEKDSYDVIFMDIQMPEMDGIEATENIHKRWGKHRPYIIAMTANAMTGDRDKCLSVGMDDYISKPVKIQAIIQAVKTMQEKNRV
ncbi:MAG: response regulator, partial [Sphaerospermopsis sp. SIO1G2]|nr:response regulator [Sphaerospermopsis sp. SIO1G2]